MGNGNGKYGYIILGTVITAIMGLVLYFSIYMANEARAGVAENKTGISVNIANITNLTASINKIDTKVDKLDIKVDKILDKL